MQIDFRTQLKGEESVAVDNNESNQLNARSSKLVPAFDDIEKNYRHSHPVAWWMALVGPVVITSAVLGLVYFLRGPDTVYSYLTAAATAFFALGRFIILLGSSEPNPDSHLFLKYLDARNLFMMLTYMDVIVAMFVAFHMGIVFKIPWVGQKIEGIVSDGHFILRKQPWIRRVAFFGLVGFVIFPTSTTGSVGGSIFGRLLGMKRWRVVMAILVGSVLGNGLMLLFANQISAYVDSDNWTFRISGVLAMIIALFVFERNFRRLKNEYLAQEEIERQMDVTLPDVRDTVRESKAPDEVTNS